MRVITLALGVVLISGFIGHWSIAQYPAGGATPGYQGPVGGGAPGASGTTPASGGPNPAPASTPPSAPRPRPTTIQDPIPPPRPPSDAPYRAPPGRLPRTLAFGREIPAHDWTRWWELNDDRFLIREGRYRPVATPLPAGDDFPIAGLPKSASQPPTLREVRAGILPALASGLRDRSPQVRAATALAIGKVAEPSEVSALVCLRELLADHDATVRERATLGLGLLGSPDAVSDLLDLAENQARGRDLAGTGSGDVPARQRFFAAVAAGLVGSRSGFRSADRALPRLLDLAQQHTAPRDAQVGAAVALQVARSGEAASAMFSILEDAEADAVARAQVAVALGKSGCQPAIGRLLDHLDDRETAIARGAALAVGLLADRSDAEACARISRVASGAPERALRNYCLLALGRIGHPAGQAFLLHKLSRGTYDDTTWSALALGLLARRFPETRAEIGTALLDAYRRTRDLEKSACALALGLAGIVPARELLAADLASGFGSPDVRGHQCSALAILGGGETIPVIRRQIRAKGDPDLLWRAAIALGRLEDQEAAQLVQRQSEDASASQPMLAAATLALGRIGDGTAAPGLIRMAANPALGAWVRAYAFEALGFLGDKDDLPLLARLQENTDPLAVTDGLSELLAIQ